MSSDEGDFSTGLDPKEHSRLLDNVLSLNKKPQLKKPSRTEPTLQISEFNLVKSITGKHGSVNVKDLTKALKKGSKHVEIGNKVLNTESKAKTLPKPLEKPQADRIRRTVAYTNVKKQLDRWDAVVTSNRGMNHLSFPLQSDKKLESAKKFTGFRLKSDLQKKLESLQPKVPEMEVFNLEQEAKYPLTMQEILERRKEGAKMRAIQSYREAKARRQNKIKSKKFHRIQRKEKMKNQLKEFEQLQKTNPEEALKKLEEMERVRAQERASLKHRSTSKWAKSKEIRAKYDKESRQALAQQLAISRDLTQKLKIDNEDSELEEEATGSDVKLPKKDESNPWIKDAKSLNEVNEFISGYRKYWDDANKNLGNEKNTVNNTDKTTNPNICPNKKVNNVESSGVQDLSLTSENNQKGNIPGKSLRNTNNSNNKNHSNISIQKGNYVVKSSGNANLNNKNDTNKKPNDSTKNKDKTHKKIKKENKLNDQQSPEPNTEKKLRHTKRKSECLGTTEWSIDYLSETDEQNSNDESENEVEKIDKMFDTFTNKLQRHLQTKLKEIKEDLQTIGKENPKDRPITRSQTKKKIKLDLNPNPVLKKPIIDEQLIENSASNELTETNTNLAVLNSILKSNSSRASKNNSISNINLDNIIKTKLVHLNTEIPDLFTTEENEESSDQRGIIMEAFEDDDVVDEFQKEKQAEIDKDKPQDIDLNLPGWGDWGGTGIQTSKRKTKRFIIKLPKDAKRRDANKGNLIINEKANSKAIKSHLVSDVLFPFKSVKDFEASIRSPVGSTFIPETAHRRIIRPAVKTRMGTIIEPMTEEVLLKKKK